MPIALALALGASRLRLKEGLKAQSPRLAPYSKKFERASGNGSAGGASAFADGVKMAITGPFRTRFRIGAWQAQGKCHDYSAHPALHWAIFFVLVVNPQATRKLKGRLPCVLSPRRSWRSQP